jgi:hypothetical protein
VGGRRKTGEDLEEHPPTLRWQRGRWHLARPDYSQRVVALALAPAVGGGGGTGDGLGEEDSEEDSGGREFAGAGRRGLRPARVSDGCKQ